MKPLTAVALNVAIVSLALVAYDVIRGDAESAPAEVAEIDLSSIEQRLDALEEAPRRTRHGSLDPSVLERLAALERARGLAAPQPAEVAEPESEPAAAPAEPRPIALREGSPWIEVEPTPEEIARFRRVAEAVKTQDIARKNAKRIDRVLDALPVNLTDDQRKGVHTRWASFQPRVGEIWGEVKQEARRTLEAGGDVDRETLVSDTQAMIADEFAGTLSGLISPGDATTIADALVAGGK